MGMYNTTTVLFLVNSFRDIAESYGYITRTVELYKRQVDSMIMSNTISVNDKELVYELLGILNTNNIKWSITDIKISQFLYAVNMIGDTRDMNIVNTILNNLRINNAINNSVANLLRKLYK